MDYYVSKKCEAPGEGTMEKPFATIGEAVQIARPGDKIIIGGGLYREWVNPIMGGSCDAERITYINKQGESPIISGAELVENWEKISDGVWKATIPNDIFSDYNPFADPIFGDWYDDLGQTHHTGELYMDGQAMYEAATLETLMENSSDAMGEKVYRWFAVVSEKVTELWGRFMDRNPNEHRMEVNARAYCFFPKSEGINYITVSGLTMEKAATQWAPPTAFQPGAIGTHWSKGWIIENCVIRDSKCSGISVGKRHDVKDNIWSINPEKGGAQTYTEIVFTNIKNGWSKENVGSHIVRNNEIYNCGQAGIVGNMGGAFSKITGNHIHDINVRGEFSGAEIAGIKLHCAIDTIIDDNCIHNCYRGLWLDWQAQGARVSKNAFFANTVEDLFIEVCHGPCVIDNNLFLSKINLQNVSQGSAFVHNLFTGKLNMFSDTNRFTPYHLPHDTFVGGVMVIYGGDDKVANNIYIGNCSEETGFGNCIYNGYKDINSGSFMQTDDCPMKYVNNTLPVDIHDNVYFNGARKYENEKGAVEVPDCNVKFDVSEIDGEYYLTTNLFDYDLDKKVDLITTDILGKSFESEAVYENADKTALIVEEDYAGNLRNGSKTCAGPFAQPYDKVLLKKRKIYKIN
ncbi:MAG TPA: hypothetical protein DEP23_02475 [Ruminococcaceae bacterium]|nr:hypothetical protein [Oscillospiraceae bacterium]